MLQLLVPFVFSFRLQIQNEMMMAFDRSHEHILSESDEEEC